MFFGIIGSSCASRRSARSAPWPSRSAPIGVGSLVNLAALIATFYLTSILFVLLVLGTIAHFAGFSILRFIAYIKDELLIVLGTHRRRPCCRT